MKFAAKNVFVIYLGIFLLSFIVFRNPGLEKVFFVLALLLFAIITFRRPEYGIYVLLGDLFVTSFGYLFQWQGVSLRIGMAVVLIVIVIFRFFQYVIARRALTTKQSLGNAHYNGIASADLAMTERGKIDFERLKKFIRQYKSLSVVYALLLVWIAASFIHGIVQNGFSNAFQDFNGFLFLLFLPIIPALKIEKEKVFTILKAGLAWLFAFASFIEIVFAWFGENEVLYTFVRDLRFGEITPFVGNFWRVFVQSGIFAVLGLLFAAILILRHSVRDTESRQQKTKRPFSFLSSFWIPDRVGNDGREGYWLFFISTVILLLSLSRSFWLGSAISLILVTLICIRRIGFIRFLQDGLRILMILVISVFFVLLISNTWLGAGKVVESRIDIAEPAVSSRSAQLGPLNDTILRSPVVGYGFGKEVRYCSNDPRRVKFHGTERPLFPDACALTSTWAFELGWHDMALKMGLIGTLLYLSFMILLMHRLYRTYIDISRITIFLSLLALIVIHAFTPYLNHPLGIGFLIITLVILSDRIYPVTEDKITS